MINNQKIFGYPVRHRQKMPFAPKLVITPEIAQQNVEIFKLEAELDRFVLSLEDHLNLATEAFASNIHISTSLEGNPLTKPDVKRITKGMLRTGIPRDDVDLPTQEILNHILAYMSEEYQSPWDVSTVCAVHRFLMSGRKDIACGEFRQEHSAVYSSKNEELFITAPPQFIEPELRSLIDWLESAGSVCYPVVAGAVFFHEFESIHPFSDGNGRCGRSLLHIYLQRHGLPNSKLCLIEQNIVSEPQRYYDLLAKTDFYNDYTDLVTHFTGAVHASYADAVKRYQEHDLLGTDLDGTARILISNAKRANNWFSLEDASAWFARISDYKLRKAIDGLVEKGAFIPKGVTRSKRYRFADALALWRESMAK